MIDPASFVDGHLEPSVDFDFDAIDRGNPLVSELSEARPIRENEAITLGRIFSMLLTYGGTNSKEFYISANVLAFALGFHPNQSASAQIIAAGLRMEKAAFLRRVNIMRRLLSARDAILPRIAGQWSRAARESIKQKTTRHHEKRKKENRNNNHGTSAGDCTAGRIVAAHKIARNGN